MNDPWANRKCGMKCATCVFFVEKKSEREIKCGTSDPLSAPSSLLEPSISKEDPRGHIGRCRRSAPTMKGFPIVFEMDWCGEHRLDENKL